MTPRVFALLTSTLGLYLTRWCLLLCLSETRCDRKKCWTLTACIGALLSAVCIISALVAGSRGVQVMLPVTAVPTLLFFFLISRYRGVRFFTTCLVADLAIANVDLCVYMLGLALYGGNLWIDGVVRPAAVVGAGVLIALLIGKRYRQALGQLDEGWLLILLVAAAMYAAMCLIAAYPTAIDRRLRDIPLGIAVLVTIELMLFLLVRMICRMLEMQRREVEEAVMRTRLAAAEDQYRLMRESVQDLLRLRHDMKYHFRVINGLMEQGDMEKLRAYFAACCQSLTAPDTGFSGYTKNQSVNILLNYYGGKARETGILTDFEILLPEELPMEEVHLTAILGNILQNALEACQELEGEGRFIHLLLRWEQEKLVLKCRNSASASHQRAIEDFISTKGNHRGTGLASVRFMVSQHRGFCQWEAEGDTVLFSAVLSPERRPRPAG